MQWELKLKWAFACVKEGVIGLPGCFVHLCTVTSKMYSLSAFLFVDYHHPVLWKGELLLWSNVHVYYTWSFEKASVSFCVNMYWCRKWVWRMWVNELCTCVRYRSFVIPCLQATCHSKPEAWATSLGNILYDGWICQLQVYPLIRTPGAGRRGCRQEVPEETRRPASSSGSTTSPTRPRCMAGDSSETGSLDLARLSFGPSSSLAQWEP